MSENRDTFCFSYNVFKILNPEPIYSFPKQALVFTCLQYKSFEKTARKGENTRNMQFLLFQHCFLPT